MAGAGGGGELQAGLAWMTSELPSLPPCDSAVSVPRLEKGPPDSCQDLYGSRWKSKGTVWKGGWGPREAFGVSVSPSSPAAVHPSRPRGPVPGTMSGTLSKRSNLANDNSCLGLALAPPLGEGLPHKGRCGYTCSSELQNLVLGLPPSADESGNTKWVKDGQNQLRQAVERGRDQNRNELGPPTKELSTLLGSLPGEEEDQEEEEEEEEDEEEDEEEEEDSTPVQSEPVTESEQSSERALPRGEQGRSASLLFGMRHATASDEDSSWASLSQGSPTGSSPDEAGGSWTVPGCGGQCHLQGGGNRKELAWLSFAQHLGEHSLKIQSSLPSPKKGAMPGREGEPRVQAGRLVPGMLSMVWCIPSMQGRMGEEGPPAAAHSVRCRAKGHRVPEGHPGARGRTAGTPRQPEPRGGGRGSPGHNEVKGRGSYLRKRAQVLNSGETEGVKLNKRLWWGRGCLVGGDVQRAFSAVAPILWNSPSQEA